MSASADDMDGCGSPGMAFPSLEWADVIGADQALPLRPVVTLVPVVLPLERTQIGDVIGPALDDWLNVIDFPTLTFLDRFSVFAAS